MTKNLIIQAVDKDRPKILRFLKRMIERNSYITNQKGVRAIADMIAKEMPAGFKHELVPDPQFSGHHFYRHLRPGRPTIVLAGHMETLCPYERDFSRLVKKGAKLLGPGTCDMKGGLVVLIWALKVLERLGRLDDLSIVCIYNSDEEYGSPNSWKLFTGMKGKADYGLVFEAAGPGNTIVTTRKGVARYRLDIAGKASHFGCLKGRKISAIAELAKKTIVIEALTRKDGSIVANVGKVAGGLAANKVAETASLDFEARYWTKANEQKTMQAIRKICAVPAIPGCSLKLHELSHRPPMQPSAAERALFNLARQLAGGLGQKIKEESRGGVSDANWLSHVGIPTIDGLGPIGDFDFTRDEYLLTKSLFDRINLVAHLLLKLGRTI